MQNIYNTLATIGGLTAIFSIISLVWEMRDEHNEIKFLEAEKAAKAKSRAKSRNKPTQKVSVQKEAKYLKTKVAKAKTQKRSPAKKAS